MKGRNCYSQFVRHPGFEKLHGIAYVKSSFLKPGDIDSFQREPFKMRTVVGSGLLSDPYQSRAWPATVLLCVFLIERSGRFRFPLTPVAERIRAGHCLFLCLTFFTVWFGPFALLLSLPQRSGQPF